jgi:hypothetical protein
VRVLKPGQSHAIRVDLSAPAWFVTKTNGPPQSLRDVRQWEAMFRLRYRAPSPDACSPLREAARIWHGDLLSRAFGGGRVD